MIPTLGVAITTLNRRDVFERTLAEYQRFTPPEIPIFIVDDGSDTPVLGAHHRNPTPEGVAAAKNASIALLMDAGVEHLLLSDDDVCPTRDGWWLPFMESERPHLLHQPTDRQPCLSCGQEQLHIYNTLPGRFECSVCSKNVQPIWEDDEFFAPQWAAGVILYVTRQVINRVGGMRRDFGRWSCETWEFSHRIHNAFNTDYPFISFKDSPFYAYDAYTTGRRSCVDNNVRDAHREKNWRLFLTFKDTSDFVPYTQTAATVCFPWRPAPGRVAAHDRCLKYWTDHGFKVVEGDSDPNLPFLCGAARNNAVRQADTDVVIVADADTIPDHISQIHDAIEIVTNRTADLCYPFDTFLHIDEKWATEDYTRASAQGVYRDSPGGIFVLRKDALDTFGGFDERFTPGVGGYDDTAFRLVCETLGIVTRIPGVAWSFNHATRPDGRPDRDFSEANRNLPRFRLYEFAHKKPDVMRELIKR